MGGSCGSCWAFSATETAESSYCLSYGRLYILSPQQLVDCAGYQYGNYGCNGGMYYNAWNYMTRYGQEENSVYPYTGRDGSCKYNAAYAKVKPTSRGTRIGQTSSAIMSAVNTRPISVGIEADSRVFQTYSSG